MRCTAGHVDQPRGVLGGAVGVKGDNDLALGCTDPAAVNYDPEATLDNNTCQVFGCTDPLACNYDSTAAGIADCNYFDTELFTLEENDFIGLFDYESCPDGYAGVYSLPVPMDQNPAGGPLTFTVFSEVEDFLVYWGFELALEDIATVTMSVCDTVLNYNSLVLGDIDMIWDGTGFPNEFYESFVVPESSLAVGCPDEEACNFDPCVHPFVEEGCEYLELGTVDGDTLVEAGGTLTFTATPAMADGNALFHASHKNLAGSGAALDVAGLAVTVGHAASDLLELEVGVIQLGAEQIKLH